MNQHFISASCAGWSCRCGRPATHKVGEEIQSDEPGRRVSLNAAASCWPARHNFTAYICCGCFKALFGSAVFCPKEEIK